MPRTVLIIGGTRNLGHYAALSFRAAGDRVTVLNRGITPDGLPADVPRLRADRTRPDQLRAAIGRSEFDLVVDTAMYTGTEASQAIHIFEHRVGHVVVISTGQVYLVRSDLTRPFVEADYAGPVMAAPDRTSADFTAWEYGIQKREAEDALFAAWDERRFPVTTVRLPMVHSPRDYYDRVRNILARLEDGGPLLVPEGARPLLRHVWVHDVVAALHRVGNDAATYGCAYNLSQDETVTLEQFLGLFADRLQRLVRLVEVPRPALDIRGILPDGAPFSGWWMSELDNRRGVDTLGLSYTPLAVVADTLVTDYLTEHHHAPSGYASRPVELALAESIARAGR